MNQKVMILPMNKRGKENCCGCTACAEVCPVHAINMKVDEEGFSYPYVEKDKCIHCGKCDRVCGFVPVEKNQESFSLPKYPAGIVRLLSVSNFTSASPDALLVLTIVPAGITTLSLCFAER